MLVSLYNLNYFPIFAFVDGVKFIIELLIVVYGYINMFSAIKWWEQVTLNEIMMVMSALY